ncbi:hypothetical protein N8584_02450 [bacterium]|nr:hypothetical protein [bacterium]MDA7679790.1 hypothetical protein [bacterium]
MKKLIAKLLVGAFSLVLCVNLSAEEWKSYKFKNEKDSPLSQFEYSDDIIVLQNGDKVEFVSFTGNTNRPLYVRLIYDDDVSKRISYYLKANPFTGAGNDVPFLQDFATIYGPCKVQVGASLDKNGGNAVFVLCSAKITRANETQGKNVTGYSLVLPESTDTSYNLVLEGSTDLVSWTADTTGTKTPSDKKRFYRLRAVKE